MEKSEVKKLSEIRKEVECTEQKWNDLACKMAENPSSACSMVLSLEKENLRNLLEDARKDIDKVLSKFLCAASACVGYLERILFVSEKLGTSYVFPDYRQSFYIIDSLKDAERMANRY